MENKAILRFNLFCILVCGYGLCLCVYLCMPKLCHVSVRYISCSKLYNEEYHKIRAIFKIERKLIFSTKPIFWKYCLNLAFMFPLRASLNSKTSDWMQSNLKVCAGNSTIYAVFIWIINLKCSPNLAVCLLK